MEKPMKRIASTVLVLLMSGLCAAAGLGDYAGIALPESPRAEAGKSNLSVMFIGVSTLVFDDGETAIMTDGYFSRPGNISTTRIEPDRARIKQALQRAGIKTLAAVIPLHSHFDHALDSPVVAQETGALLVGSRSTAFIGQGYSFPKDRTRVVANGDTLTFGKFKVTFVVGAHLPADFALGEITSPISLPAKASDFKVGEAYALLIENEGRTVLINASAGFTPNSLAGRKADVVYLGIAGLGSQQPDYQDGYWQEMAKGVAAKRVIPIHWDNFYRSLDEPLMPAAGFERSMGSIQSRGKRDNVDVRFQAEWKWVDPFSGLPR
jgi:L-ascorbate metabolism protein UlaG (beta-lactamase superfamily)